MAGAASTMALEPELLKEALTKHLFAEQEELNTYAVLDGASIPELLDHLYGESRPDFACLYRGELSPDMAEVAPYVVRLKTGQPFTDWLLSEGWGQHWGIFALARTDLRTMRKHFRTFLMVKDPQGKQMYFRFYDPRVLTVFLPTCDKGQLTAIFGPLARYICEDGQIRTLNVFSTDSGMLKSQRIELTA